MGMTFLFLVVIICGVLLMLWAGVAFIQDKKYFTSAPKDVQEAIQPHKERFKGQHAVGWILMAVAAVMVISAVIIAFADGIKRGWVFWQFFLRFLIILDGYKVWDMIFLDWYLLTRSHFYQHYFPEVADCESLKHTGFNRKFQLLKLCVIFPAVSLSLAGICILITALI